MKHATSILFICIFLGGTFPAASAHVANAEEAAITEKEAGLSTVVSAKAGLTPHSPFYFLDRLGETLWELFIFNADGKARLQTVFAAERVAEIKAVLETRGVEAPGIAIAESRLVGNIERAAALLEREKTEGKNISEFAQELSGKFLEEKQKLKHVFRVQEELFREQEKLLKEQIRLAREEGAPAREIELRNELEMVRAERKLLKFKEDEQEERLEEEEKKLHKHLEKEGEAKEAIREAEEEKLEILEEVALEGIQISSEEFKKFDGLLGQAKELLERGNFEGAMHLAEQAEESLETIGRVIDAALRASETEEEDREPAKAKGEESGEEAGDENTLEEKEVEEEEENINELLRGLDE